MRVKIWCEECEGKRSILVRDDAKYRQYIICETCEGKGYTLKDLYELAEQSLPENPDHLKCSYDYHQGFMAGAYATFKASFRKVKDVKE